MFVSLCIFNESSSPLSQAKQLFFVLCVRIVCPVSHLNLSNFTFQWLVCSTLLQFIDISKLPVTVICSWEDAFNTIILCCLCSWRFIGMTLSQPLGYFNYYCLDLQLFSNSLKYNNQNCGGHFKISFTICKCSDHYFLILTDYWVLTLAVSIY